MEGRQTARELRSDRGTVLVAAMVILALLSLLGAGSLLNATLDTQLARNQRTSKEAFYAAEAALEVGVGRVMAAFRDELRPYAPGLTADWTEPSTAEGDPYNNPFPPPPQKGFTTEFRITNPLGSDPSAEPEPFLFTTVENNQQIIHFAYEYQVEARATGDLGSEAMAETVRVLETPLVQYYIFFEDDLSWHPGPEMISWGQVHTNGNLFFAPGNPLTFRNFSEGAATPDAPNVLTVHGNIYVGEYLAQVTATPPASGTLSRASADVLVRVRNLHTVADAPGDYENIDKDITPANAATEEARFVDSDGTHHVRIGVDRMPSASYQSLVRDGFYEEAANEPKKPGVDAIKIVVEGGQLKVYLTPYGGAQQDVTSLVENYALPTGDVVDLTTWPAGAKERADDTNADGILGEPATTVPMLPRTIVYSPEAPVHHDMAGNAGVYDDPATGRTNINPRYPCVLERKDGRENRLVDLTVIDVQRLQYWYRDYIDALDGTYDRSVDLSGRKLLIYVSRSLSGGGYASGTGANALQAVKLIGSRAGRRRGNTLAVERQRDPTFVVPTTIVTDNPVYLEGDYNAPGATSGSFEPGAFGSAVVSDAVILISNAWGHDPDVYQQLNTTSWTYTDYQATDTAYNTAIFTGRYNFRLGGGGEEAGIHNFVRFNERWGNSVDCRITGCLINLWFSNQATAPHGLGSYYSPPRRVFGWDVNFRDPNYWPPYVPSIYSIERAAWREE